MISPASRRDVGGPWNRAAGYYVYPGSIHNAILIFGGCPAVRGRYRSIPHRMFFAIFHELIWQAPARRTMSRPAGADLGNFDWAF